MKLLVVEDEPRIAAFIHKGLRAQGFDVESVETGGAALHAARADRFDLVLLDLGLPDLDGLEVLRRLRASGNAVPVVILTARNEPDDRSLGAALGAAEYLTKPFSFPHLVATVRTRLLAPETS